MEIASKEYVDKSLGFKTITFDKTGNEDGTLYYLDTVSDSIGVTFGYEGTLRLEFGGGLTVCKIGCYKSYTRDRIYYYTTNPIVQYSNITNLVPLLIPNGPNKY